MERWLNGVDEKIGGSFDYLFYVYNLLKNVQRCVHDSALSQCPQGSASHVAYFFHFSFKYVSF